MNIPPHVSHSPPDSRHPDASLGARLMDSGVPLFAVLNVVVRARPTPCRGDQSVQTPTRQGGRVAHAGWSLRWSLSHRAHRLAITQIFTWNPTWHLLTGPKLPNARLTLRPTNKVRRRSGRRSPPIPSQKRRLRLLPSLPHAHHKTNVPNSQRLHKSHNHHLPPFPVRIRLRPNPFRQPPLYLHPHPHLPLLLHPHLPVPLSQPSILRS